MYPTWIDIHGTRRGGKPFPKWMGPLFKAGARLLQALIIGSAASFALGALIMLVNLAGGGETPRPYYEETLLTAAPLGLNPLCRGQENAAQRGACSVPGTRYPVRTSSGLGTAYRVLLRARR